jgi:two-component system phosphate regulon sensor histidine kinase PhoR
MKTDFINNMTHEFKTPIATISLASDSVLSPTIMKDEQKVRKFIRIIKEENTRMLNQVEKVLQIARIDKKNFELRKTRIELHELIKKAVEHSQLNIEKKGGEIILELNASLTELLADQTHISNIIHNILDNAIKYTPEKPHIVVSTKNLLNGIEMIIKDNGVGMSKEARKHIFDKFYRIPTGNVHNIKGFGLGLSYVKAMVEAHEGKVSVKSELGKGSELIIFFPQKNVS